MKTKTAEGKRMETNQSASASQLFPSVLLVFCFHLSFLILCRMEIHGPSLVNPLLREYVNDFQLPRDLHVKISALGSCHWHFSTCGFSFGHSSFISTTIGKARSTVEIKIRVGQRPGPVFSWTVHWFVFIPAISQALALWRLSSLSHTRFLFLFWKKLFVCGKGRVVREHWPGQKAGRNQTKPCSSHLSCP